MHVHIVHRRDEQTITKIDEFSTFAVEVRQVIGNTYYKTVLHSHVTILVDLKTVFLFRKEDMSLIDFFHDMLLMGFLVI